MTVNLERIFFVYILQNKKYFSTIEPLFFGNPDIKFVYRVVRDYVQESLDIDVPSPKQIAEMVKLEDKDNTITNDMLLQILKVSLKEYDEEKFIKPKFNTWILVNRIKTGTSDVIDDSRELDGISNYNDALSMANRIKDRINDATSTKFDSDDTLGSDFDDEEAHIQDLDSPKVKTGWDSLDSVLGGGWDLATLNLIMGSTNSGKCCTEGNIHIRNKKNNEVTKVTINKLFNYIKTNKGL